MSHAKKIMILSSAILLASCQHTTPTIAPPVQPAPIELPSTISTVKQPLSDSVITQKVSDKFTTDNLYSKKDIASATIQVRTIDRVVYLVGLADNQAQKDKAISIAYSVEGVADVDASQLLIANQ